MPTTEAAGLTGSLYPCFSVGTQQNSGEVSSAEPRGSTHAEALRFSLFRDHEAGSREEVQCPSPHPTSQLGETAWDLHGRPWPPAEGKG